MSIEFRPKSAALHDRMLKAQRLMFDVTIVSDATPADKEHQDDVSGSVILRTEGKTAVADAVEDVSSLVTTAADATGIFAVLIDEEKVDKVYKVDLQVDTGTIALGAQGAKVTSGGRIVIDLDSNQSLASQDITVTIIVDYLKKR